MKNKKVFMGCMIRHGGLLAAEAILALAVSVILVQGNKIISGVIDEMLSGRQVLFGSFLLQFLIYTVVGTIAAFLQSAAASRYAVAVCTEYRDLVGEKLYRTEYKYFDANYSATLLNKVIGDLGEIASFLETVLPDMIASFIGIFTYAVYIGETNLGLLMVILITYPLIFWIAGKLVKRIRGLQANYRQKTDVMAQIAQDAVSGILVLRSFGIEEVFRKKMHKASVELVENEEKRTQITNTAIVVRKLIQWLPNIISAVYAVWLVSRGAVSLGGLVGFILILSKFVDAYTGLPFAMVDASTGMVSVDRVEKILSAEEEPSGEGCADAVTRAAENVIAFDQVDFSYHENVPVLQGLTFSVKKGENVAFVGESGGGKSTIFRILCGFYEKTGGEYRIFGRPIEEWNREALREQIALVSQNVFLFPTTIAENIAYSKPGTTREQIEEACKKAKIHEFIQILPEGYETMVGERGAILSGGQKQRIAIARAILKNAPVLLLDEPTSALDVETESEIQEAIRTVMAGRTCITIAHRLSTIQNADRIYVLKQGQIAECGTHEELLATGGAYAAMYGEEADHAEL
ncbi:MAG: ABC transporter ATP-binding protein [Waltera sp.]